MTLPAKHTAQTATIVSAFVGRNQLPPSDIPQLIASVHTAIAGLVVAAPPASAPQEPAVPIRRSITEEHIICLEDGAKLSMMKRYLMRQCGLTPDAYRARWNLPASYPHGRASAR